jgi:dsRNA-specific ribonuclease
MKLDIKLQEAKQAIAVPDFKRDDLLQIALTEPADLNHLSIPRSERDRLERSYRRLAFVGDALFDSVLADYLFNTNQELTHEDLDDWRQEIASKESFTEFAIELGLPKFSSSWKKRVRKPPEQEPRLWAEMFEAVVGVVFIDGDRDFAKLSSWLVNSFIRDAIGDEVNEQDDETTVTTADYLDMIGLEGSLGSMWAPGDDDDSL